jgi:hypothetical protein
MAFDVLLSEDAARDIEDIYCTIAEHDSLDSAERVLVALTGCGIGVYRCTTSFETALRASSG